MLFMLKFNIIYLIFG